VSYREKGSSPACSSGKRNIQIADMLHFIKDQIWKNLFGRAADGIEQSFEDKNEFRIYDRFSITDRFVQKTEINCSSFIAGIVEGILVSGNMDCKVTVKVTETS